MTTARRDILRTVVESLLPGEWVTYYRDAKRTGVIKGIGGGHRGTSSRVEVLLRRRWWWIEVEIKLGHMEPERMVCWWPHSWAWRLYSSVLSRSKEHYHDTLKHGARLFIERQARLLRQSEL